MHKMSIAYNFIYLHRSILLFLIFNFKSEPWMDVLLSRMASDNLIIYTNVLFR